MNRRDAEWRRLVDDIHRYGRTIAHWVDKGYEAFLDPETGSQATIERQLEMIEEAAKALGASFRKVNPSIPWDPIFEIRNEISHPFQMSYDPERLWSFVRGDLPKVMARLRRPRYPD